ncbi:hypothetical protein PV08_05043 [Exophiala spinifera]|uniref:Ribokinase n=1 Tax=Exophiala spinifera TaxID=91928 RepID=A0A0D2BFR1_9EURO|nr:uncharacterized protein PV08_05043 [Exophiala spinifera]KIW17848.1 hypothetical protein PV08_05043 [Exophiala spinifera]
MESKPTIVVIGSLNVDFVTLTARVPGPGETLRGEALTVSAGGKGANQAVACGRAAFTSREEQTVAVSMIGAVGARDPYYESLLKPLLESSGVRTQGIDEIEGVGTGTATIIVEGGTGGGENRIIIVPGANGNVDDATKVLATMTEMVPRAPDVVVMQGEIPFTVVMELLKKFNSGESGPQNICVVFNPAPMPEDGIPLGALRNLAVLVVNETECLLLCRHLEQLGLDMASEALRTKEGEEKEEEEELLTEPFLTATAHRLHDLVGISVVVVTLGSRGVFYSARKNGSSHGEGQEKRIHSAMIPAAKVDHVVDTTAAGDTFVGYLASALATHLHSSTSESRAGIDDFDLANAVHRANQAAAKCVRRRGAAESIPYGYE